MKLSVFYEHIAEAAAWEQQQLQQQQQQQQQLHQHRKRLSEAALSFVLEQVRRAGISYVDIEAERLLGAEGDEILAALKAAGISVSCIYRFFDWGYDSDTARGHELVQLAKRVGAGRVMVIPGFLREEEALDVTGTGAGSKHDSYCCCRAQLLPPMIRMIQELCDYGAAAAPELMILMEDFDDDRSPCSTFEELKCFIDGVGRDNFGITLDTGNFLYSGEDVLEAYEALAPWIRHVHLKDRSSLCMEEGDEGKEALDGRWMYPAAVMEGELPIGEIIRRLMNSGYDGIYAIEHFGKGKGKQLETMKRSAGHVLKYEESLMPCNEKNIQEERK